MFRSPRRVRAVGMLYWLLPASCWSMNHKRCCEKERGDPAVALATGLMRSPPGSAVDDWISDRSSISSSLLRVISCLSSSSSAPGLALTFSLPSTTDRSTFFARAFSNTAIGILKSFQVQGLNNPLHRYSNAAIRLKTSGALAQPPRACARSSTPSPHRIIRTRLLKI
ncbi:hypothetical protein D3C71_1601090 [compost metagenome]